jgi:hypothetical protein
VTWLTPRLRVRAVVMFLGIAAARGILYVAICDPERALTRADSWRGGEGSCKNGPPVVGVGAWRGFHDRGCCAREKKTSCGCKVSPYVKSGNHPKIRAPYLKV